MSKKAGLPPMLQHCTTRTDQNDRTTRHVPVDGITNTETLKSKRPWKNGWQNLVETTVRSRIVGIKLRIEGMMMSSHGDTALRNDQEDERIKGKAGADRDSST